MSENSIGIPLYFERQLTNQQMTLENMRSSFQKELDEVQNLMKAQASRLDHLNQIEQVSQMAQTSFDGMLPQMNEMGVGTDNFTAYDNPMFNMMDMPDTNDVGVGDEMIDPLVSQPSLPPLQKTKNSFNGFDNWDNIGNIEEDEFMPPSTPVIPDVKNIDSVQDNMKTDVTKLFTELRKLSRTKEEMKGNGRIQKGGLTPLTNTEKNLISQLREYAKQLGVPFTKGKSYENLYHGIMLKLS